MRLLLALPLLLLAGLLAGAAHIVLWLAMWIDGETRETIARRREMSRPRGSE